MGTIRILVGVVPLLAAAKEVEVRISLDAKDAPVVDVVHARAEQVAPLLKRLLPGGDVTYDARTNTLIVTR